MYILRPVIINHLLFLILASYILNNIKAPVWIWSETLSLYVCTYTKLPLGFQTKKRMHHTVEKAGTRPGPDARWSQIPNSTHLISYLRFNLPSQATFHYSYYSLSLCQLSQKFDRFRLQG
jgi:hypothetical protein